MASFFSSHPRLDIFIEFIESLIRRSVNVIILAIICWASFYTFGVIISSVRLITYRNIASLHAGLLIAYLLSIIPADLLFRSIIASVVFQISMKFIGMLTGPVFVLRKPMKLNESFAVVILATVSLLSVGINVWLEDGRIRR